LGGVRGKGLLLALDLKRDIAPEVAAQAFRRGVLINAPRPDSLRFMPALTVTHEEIDHMTRVLDQVLDHVLGEVDEASCVVHDACRP
jgi:acetylornithine/N-succinyldiaminopimelate aminotransferase